MLRSIVVIIWLLEMAKVVADVSESGSMALIFEAIVFVFACLYVAAISWSHLPIDRLLFYWLDVQRGRLL